MLSIPAASFSVVASLAVYFRLPARVTSTSRRLGMAQIASFSFKFLLRR